MHKYLQHLTGAMANSLHKNRDRPASLAGEVDPARKLGWNGVRLATTVASNPPSGRHAGSAGRMRDFVRQAILAVAVVLTGTAAAGEEADRHSVLSSSIVSSEEGLQLVHVIDRSEIELSGMRNVWDLLAGRSAYNSFGLYTPLHLGSRRVAILINERRLTHTFPDLDSIPTSAIERIEVLSDGAVAVLGPEALTGAINIVLRNRFEGVEFEAGGEHPEGRGGDTNHVSGLWGGSVGGGHLTLGVDSFHRNEIRRSDRDYSRSRWSEGGYFADASDVSTAGNTVFFLHPRPNPPSAHSLGPCEGDGFTGPLREPFGVPGQGCGYAWSEHEWSWEKRGRQSVFLAFERPIGEKESMYVEARLVDGEFIRPHLSPSAQVFLFEHPRPGGPNFGAELENWQNLLSRVTPDLHPAPETSPAAVMLRHRFRGPDLAPPSGSFC